MLEVIFDVQSESLINSISQKITSGNEIDGEVFARLVHFTVLLTERHV